MLSEKFLNNKIEKNEIKKDLFLFCPASEAETACRSQENTTNILFIYKSFYKIYEKFLKVPG